MTDQRYSAALTATDHYLDGRGKCAERELLFWEERPERPSSAGNCLALLSQNSYGAPYVSIVMGASTKELLYQEMNSLLENVNN